MAAAVDYTIRAGDTAPAFPFTCEDANGPVNLTGCTAKFHLAKAIGKPAVIDAAAVIDPDQVTKKGQGEYRWALGDTTPLGGLKCFAEIEVTFPDLSIKTFPNGSNKYAIIEITKQLA